MGELQIIIKFIIIFKEIFGTFEKKKLYLHHDYAHGYVHLIASSKLCYSLDNGCADP